MESGFNDYSRNVENCSDSQSQWTENDVRNTICGGEMRDKAVIDRFEGDIAVLIVGNDEKRMEVPRKLLPNKAKEGHWLQV
jgi:hypothetical protein